MKHATTGGAVLIASKGRTQGLTLGLALVVAMAVGCDDGSPDADPDGRGDSGSSDSGPSLGGAADSGGAGGAGGSGGRGGAGGGGGVGGVGGAGGEGGAGGVGGGGVPADAGPVTPDPDATPPEDEVSGYVYRDLNDSDLSWRRGGLEPGIDAPLGGVAVELFGSDAARTVTTDDDGRFVFSDLPDGVYVLRAPTEEGHCARRNCPRRFPDAVAEGKVVVVTFGDSIPVVGDRPFFPARLKTLLADLVEVEDRNVAVGGSTSVQWLPGTRHFNSRLLPAIEDADVAVISLGGNDILNFAADPSRLRDIPAAVAGAVLLVGEIVGNVRATVRGIRAVRPDLDVVFCLYADYSLATDQQMWAIVSRVLGPEQFKTVFDAAIAAFPDDEGFVLVDLYAASQTRDVGAMLADPLHFNDIGQTFYAEELFQTLGGVLVGPSPLGGEPTTPLGTSAGWSFSD